MSQAQTDLTRYQSCPRAGDGFGRAGDWTRDVFSDELFTCPLCGLTFPMTAAVTVHPSAAGVALLAEAAGEAGWGSLAEGRARGVRAVLRVRERAILLGLSPAAPGKDEHIPPFRRPRRLAAGVVV